MQLCRPLIQHKSPAQPKQLAALAHGVRGYVSCVPSLIPSLPVHVVGNPPGPLVAVRAGYHTRVAATGEDAVRYAAADRPDVVVLDPMLPDVDGLAVMRRLRAQRRHAAVILLTAKGRSLAGSSA